TAGRSEYLYNSVRNQMFPAGGSTPGARKTAKEARDRAAQVMDKIRRGQDPGDLSSMPGMQEMADEIAKGHMTQDLKTGASAGSTSGPNSDPSDFLGTPK